MEFQFCPIKTLNTLIPKRIILNLNIMKSLKNPPCRPRKHTEELAAEKFSSLFRRVLVGKEKRMWGQQVWVSGDFKTGKHVGKEARQRFFRRVRGDGARREEFPSFPRFPSPRRLFPIRKRRKDFTIGKAWPPDMEKPNFKLSDTDTFRGRIPTI